MRTLTLEPTEVKFHPGLKYDETLKRMQDELDICMEPDFVGDGAKWFSGVPLDMLDEVLSTFKFNRDNSGLDMTVAGGDVFAPVSAYVAVMMELFSTGIQEFFPMEFVLIEFHGTMISTSTSRMRLLVGRKGFSIKSISK